MGAKWICDFVFEPNLATKSDHHTRIRDCAGEGLTVVDVLVSLVLRIFKVRKRQHATSRKKMNTYDKNKTST